MPKETPVDSPPAAETGGPIEHPQSSEVAAYWLKAVVDSADDAVITKTLEGVITSWNPGAQRIFGYTADEIIGRSVTVLIPEEHLDEEPGILARIRAGERIEHYQTVRRRKDGTLVDISLTVSPAAFLTGETLTAMSTRAPSLRTRIVSRWLTRSPRRRRSCISASCGCSSLGTMSEMWRPTASSAV